jgi:hypothetical protein
MKTLVFIGSTILRDEFTTLFLPLILKEAFQDGGNPICSISYGVVLINSLSKL